MEAARDAALYYRSEHSTREVLFALYVRFFFVFLFRVGFYCSLRALWGREIRLCESILALYFRLWPFHDQHDRINLHYQLLTQTKRHYGPQHGLSLPWNSSNSLSSWSCHRDRSKWAIFHGLLAEFPVHESSA
jgi:hypothetical protein